MKTGLKNLDNIFNIDQAQLVLLTGNRIVDMLSGDIANNICLAEDRYEVLEVVSCFKEYLIKRLFVNQANVNYRKWTHKNEYTEEELKQIGQATVDLIETTTRLPRIIENDLWNLKDLEKYIYKFVNSHADRDEIMSLIVIDIYPFNSYPYKKEIDFNKNINFIKAMNEYSKRYNCPILVVCTNDIVLNEVKEYVDKILKLGDRYDSVLNVDIIENDKIINSCKLKYNFDIRKFEDC